MRIVKLGHEETIVFEHGLVAYQSDRYHHTVNIVYVGSKKRPLLCKFSSAGIFDGTYQN